MNYQDWNDLLLKHFFAPERNDEQVFVTVNRDILNELGKNFSGMCNGAEDFVKAVVFWAGTSRNICERAEDLRSAFDDGLTGEHPTFFGVLCFFVLAWGEDADLSAANYYDRLNNLLAEGGAAMPRVGTQQFRTTVSLWESLGRWSSRGRVTTDWGGRFVPRSFGREYVGYPLAQAMLTAVERQNLERLFDQFYCEYDANEVSIHDMDKLLSLRGEQGLSSGAWRIFQNCDMRDAFVGMSCSLYRDWCNRCVDDTTETAVTSVRFGVRLVLRYDRLGNVSMACRLYFPNGDCPDDGCKVSLRTAAAQTLVDRILVARQSACWSGLFHPIDFGQLDQGTRIVVHSNDGHERILPIAGLRQGAVYFEHDPFHGEWSQLTNANTRVRCRLLLKGEAEGYAIQERNHEVLTDCVQLPGGWELWDSPNGLVDVSGIGKLEAPPSIRLQGGLKLVARGDRYSEHGAPRIYLQGTQLDGYELRVISKSRANQMVYHKAQLSSGHSYSIPTEALAPDQSYEVQLVRTTHDEPERSKGFSLEKGGTLQSLEQLPDDHWPTLPAAPGQFLFSLDSFSLSLNADRRVGGELLVTQDDLPAKCYSSHWVEGLKIMLTPKGIAAGRELVQHGDGHWEIPGGLQPGRYHVRASWLGMEIGKPVPFKLGELPRCQLRIDNADRVFSGNANEPVVYVVAQDSIPRLIIDSSEKIHARFFLGDAVVFSHEAKSVICEVRPDWLIKSRTIRAKCFVGTIELADFEALFVSYPIVLVQVEDGEMWPDTRIYQSSRRPYLHVVAEGFVPTEFTVLVGDHECSCTGGFFHVPVGLVGGTHAIQVKWKNLLLAHEGSQNISIEAAPEYLIELQGGRQGPGGGYYQNALPRVTLGGREGLPPPPNLSVVLDGAKACDLNENGRIEIGQLKAGQHQLQLHWRGLPVGDEICLKVEPPFTTSLMPTGGLMVAQNTYLASDLPRVFVKNPAEKFLVVCRGRDLKRLDDNLFSLEGIESEGGQIKVEYQEEEITLASCRIDVIDESWQAVGRLAGQLTSANGAHDWHSCWFTKKNGKHRAMLLGPGCPKGACATCTTPTGAPSVGQQDWRKIIRHGSLRVSNTDQWKRFIAYAGGKNR